MNRRLAHPSNIWITGAGSGIGEALVRAFASGNHRLLLTGRRETRLWVLEELAPTRIDVCPGDTTSPDGLQSVSQALADIPCLNMAILNAGTCEYMDTDQFDSGVVERNLQTNVVGTARSIEVALPALRKASLQGQPATVVIISSSAWWFPFGRAEGYGASKAALTYLARSLRADLTHEGIDVVVVSPGFVKTPLTDRNDFPMPFLLTAEEAADRIISGIAKGKTEIAFPRRFTCLLALLGALPQPLVDRMAARMTRKPIR
ncbi:SDR family NAD(P)-dependent oxidoreductase [Marinobacter salinexigens]|uniref:SDR family NAD(P)-dependent oxidoreductase n=1 Tax=Marinobacter salinexigens TaxID=2919747 RepID=A0A5B0VM20_9GAMM|nr:SDR family NAD(P)-dependent oxidoreductase [Marinobacter salinexigens]KAA1175175.1 SDR family NAD(P)-dependent oxidoreductase [Marinobacter salinexigens]